MGKTYLVRRIAEMAVAQRMSVNVVDPRMIELRDVDGVERYASSPAEIEDLVRAMHELMRRRYADLEGDKLRREQLHPVLLILDGFEVVREVLQGAHEAAGGTGGAPSLTLVTDLLALARPVGIHLLVSVTRPDGEVMPGTARENLEHRISLGRLSSAASCATWGDPDIWVDRLGQAIATVAPGGRALVQLDESLAIGGTS